MIELPWPPTVNHYYTVARGRKILSERGRSYKKECAYLMAGQRVSRLTEGPFQVGILAFPPDNRRRDLDNLFKPILDSLTEYGAITDDSEIDYLSIERCKNIKSGKIEVIVTCNNVTQEG